MHLSILQATWQALVNECPHLWPLACLQLGKKPAPVNFEPVQNFFCFGGHDDRQQALKQVNQRPFTHSSVGNRSFQVCQISGHKSREDQDMPGILAFRLRKVGDIGNFCLHEGNRSGHLHEDLAFGNRHRIDPFAKLFVGYSVDVAQYFNGEVPAMAVFCKNHPHFIGWRPQGKKLRLGAGGFREHDQRIPVSEYIHIP